MKFNRFCLIFSFILILFVTIGCGSSVDSDLNDEEVIQESEGVWQQVNYDDFDWQEMNSLPIDREVEINSLVGKDGQLYLNESDTGVWKYNGQGWEHYLAVESRYGTRNLINVNGELFLQSHTKIKRIKDGEIVEEISFPDEIEDDAYGLGITAGENRILVWEDRTEPKVFYYNLEQEEWINTNFSHSFDNAKPHIQIEEDKQGNIWYRTNYQGVYKYDGSNWTKVSERSGALGITRRGRVYLSYEEEKYTQISNIFVYQGGDDWKQVQTAKGYSISSTGFGVDKALFLSGRFGGSVIKDNKKWLLPSAIDDLGLNADEAKSVRIHHFASINQSIYAVQEYKKNDTMGQRLLKCSPNLNDLPYYTTNIDLESGGYLAKKGLSQIDGNPLAVEWLADGRIAAAFNTEQVYKEEIKLNSSSGQGIILILNSQGTQIEKAFRLDSQLLDFDIQPETNQAAVALGDKFSLINLETGEVTEVADAGGYKRVAISENTKVAALSDKEITLYGNNLEVQFSKRLKRNYIKDIVLSAKEELIYTIGFDNKTLPSGNPVQVAYLTARDYQGQYQWQKFGFDGSDLSNNIADTRLYRVEYKNDKLYLTGESAGTQTIFRYDGDSYRGDVVLSYTDHYNDLWDSGAAHITYFAHLDAGSGRIQDAKLSMARLSSGKSNTFRVRDIAAGEIGVFLGGMSSYQLANREAQTINETTVSEYAGGDPALLGVDHNFEQRLTWTTFNQDEAVGQLKSLAIKDNKLVALGYIKLGEAFSKNAIYSSKVDWAPYLTVIDLQDNFR